MPVFLDRHRLPGLSVLGCDAPQFAPRLRWCHSIRGYLRGDVSLALIDLDPGTSDGRFRGALISQCSETPPHCATSGFLPSRSTIVWRTLKLLFPTRAVA